MDRDPLMMWLEYKDLPLSEQAVVRPLYDAADTLCQLLKPNAERTVMLRRLIEAKDQALRAAKLGRA